MNFKGRKVWLSHFACLFGERQLLRDLIDCRKLSAMYSLSKGFFFQGSKREVMKVGCSPLMAKKLSV